MHRESLSKKFPLGAKLPSFSLTSVDNNQVSEAWFDGADVRIVLFICNHCPYVQGSYHHFVQAFESLPRDQVKMIAISSNDAAKYPEDSFERMKHFAKEWGFSFPYLYDEDQSIAKAFDAQCTPEAYIFDRTNSLVYHGAINDSHRDPSGVQVDYLGVAARQILSKVPVDPASVLSVGCSIKWK